MSDKPSIAEMKAYLKKYKSVHGKPISKMSKAEMEALSHVVKQHEKMASMPEHEFEKHVSEMKKMRDMHGKKEEMSKAEKNKSSEAQMMHRKAFADWVKSGKKVSFSEFKGGMPHDKTEEKKEKKAEVVQKDAEPRVALGRKPLSRDKKEQKVEKELVEDLSPEKKSKKKSA